MGSVNYSDSANGWDVTISWSCKWNDSSATMSIGVNENKYSRTFQVVQRSNTGNRYNSGEKIKVGTEYLLYVYKNGSYSQQAGPFTVTAPARPTYRITYNANGGTGAPSNQTKTEDINLTLSGTKPTRTGYTFVSWNTRSDGSGKTYSPGGTYSANAAATLYAIWEEITYTVTYDANGGTGAPSSQTKIHDKTLQLSAEKPSRTGYKFFNWATNADGSGDRYTANSYYRENADVTLYAIWTPIAYTVVYNSNGGTGTMDNQQIQYDKVTNLRQNAFSRDGHSFLGWATSPTGNVIYENGASVSNLLSESGQSITLYAVWGINAITITFDAATNGGTTEETSRNINYGYAIGNLPTATRPYYKFSGWFTEPSGGTKVTAATTFIAAATLYAQFAIDASVRVKTGSQWKPGIPYVKVNGMWRKGYAWVKANGSWKQGIG